MVGIFCSESEVIVVGLDSIGMPIDKNLFGPDSGRDLKDFSKSEVDFSENQSIVISSPFRLDV